MGDGHGNSNREHRAPVMLGEIIRAIVARHEGAPRTKRSSSTMRVFEAFAGLGPPFTRHAEPAYFKARVLTLVVDESSWLTELTFLKPELLSRLNTRLGSEMVQDLRMRHGPIGKVAEIARPVYPPPPVLDPEREAAILGIAAFIRNAELREVVARAARWGLGRKKPAPTSSSP